MTTISKVHATIIIMIVRRAGERKLIVSRARVITVRTALLRSIIEKLIQAYEKKKKIVNIEKITF